jgi:long-chain fatty acid transport protein
LKKKFIMLAAVLALSTGALFAGNLDYLGNQSAVYLQSLNRNAATDGADIVNYNPAGTAFLPGGLHLDLSNQFLFKMYEHSAKVQFLGNSVLDDTFKPGMLTPFLPNFYLTYNFGTLGLGRLALNLQAGVTAGGGNLEYGSGTAGSAFALYGLRGGLLQSSGTNIGNVISQNFTAESIYYGVALGGAYSFLDDMLAVSLGARLVIPRRSFSMEGQYMGAAGPVGIKAEYEYNALGVTPILGFDVRPIEKLTIGLRWEFETFLKFKYEEKSLTVNTLSPLLSAGVTRGVKSLLSQAGITAGESVNMNLPHILGVGVEYEVIPGLALDLSGTVYFLPYADVPKAKDYFDIGYDVGLGAKWQIFDALKLGFGFSYTESGTKAGYFNESVLNASANPPLDSISLGLGGTYSFGFGLDLNLGVLYCHYLPADYKASASGGLISTEGTNKKDVVILGIGVSYHY